MESTYSISEHIKRDEILQFSRRRLRIKDCIFEYDHLAGWINIRGELNPDLKRKYLEMDAAVFEVTIGKSLIYNSEVNKDYVHYGLTEIFD